MSNIVVKFNNVNFRVIPPNKANPDRSPLGILEFMGGSQMVVNSALWPAAEGVTAFVEGSYMGSKTGTQFRFGELVDLQKDGKPLVDRKIKAGA